MIPALSALGKNVHLYIFFLCPISVYTVSMPRYFTLQEANETLEAIRPLMDENALNTGAGRRQLLTEIRRLNDAVGL